MFWYPRAQGLSQWERVRLALKHKSTLLANILSEAPSSSSYDRVYDSQDELGLVIYCKLESLLKGKKINSYRFSFSLQKQTLG